MAETWFISDHHFQHKRILTLTDDTGMLIRPEFSDVDQMNQTMIKLHNESIHDGDAVWFLGDVVWKDNAESIEILKQLNGKLNLVIGNHDDGRFLAPYFYEVVLWKKFKEFDFICSHVPLSEQDLNDRVKFNVHGHLHEKNVMDKDGKEDLRYLNVGVEQMGYQPINLDTVRSLLAE